MLTDAVIHRALKSGKNQQLSDGSGRGKGRLLMIIRSGRGEWYAQQWMGKAKRLKKLGSYPSMTLKEARERFQADYAEAIEKKHDIRISISTSPGTIKHLFDGYVASLRAANKRSADEAEYNLNHVLEHIDNRLLARDVTTDMLLTVLRPIYQRGSKGRADHVRGYIRSAFNYGIRADNDYRSSKPKRYLITVNPAEAIPPEPKTMGNRWLSIDELRTFWAWLHDSSPYNPKAGHGMVESNLVCLRVIALTGQRVEMIARLRPEQFNGELLEWEITKSGQPHVLPTPRQAISLLNQRKLYNYEWLFPSAFNPTKHVSNELMQAIVQRFCDRSGVAKFTPRDLRRTWKTLAGHAGITKVDRDLVQVHARSDVSSRHYDRYEYLPEKRAAMQRWSEWFADIIEKPLI